MKPVMALSRAMMRLYIMALRVTKKRNKKAEKQKAGETYQLWRMEKPGYQRSREKKHHIAEEAHGDVEPEHSVIVVFGGLPDVYQSLHKAAVKQIGGNERENGKHPHYTIVVRGEHARKEETEDEVQHLHHAAVQRPPEQALGRFFFQRFHLCRTYLLCKFTTFLRGSEKQWQNLLVRLAALSTGKLGTF